MKQLFCYFCSNERLNYDADIICFMESSTLKMTFQNCPPQVKESEPCYYTWVIVCMLHPRQKEISLARWIFSTENNYQSRFQVIAQSQEHFCTGKSKPLKTKRGSGLGPIVSINCSPPHPPTMFKSIFLSFGNWLDQDTSWTLSGETSKSKMYRRSYPHCAAVLKLATATYHLSASLESPLILVSTFMGLCQLHRAAVANHHKPGDLK